MKHSRLLPLLLIGFLGMSAEDRPAAVHRGPQPREFGSLNDAHATYSVGFANKPGFGFGRMAFLPPRDLLSHDGIRYEFQTPDLLGLEAEPKAYVAGHEPFRVAELSRTEARARLTRRTLTDAELEAVKKLRTGRDLVTVPATFPSASHPGPAGESGLLAVGALRASAGCAKCHDVPEGTLLGAFVYHLLPAKLTNQLARLPAGSPVFAHVQSATGRP